MGIYLNPGNMNFKETLSAEIYVDKTMMISVINKFMDTGNKYICVSRPRRFGKTITGNMLSAYYSKGCDSKDLFAPYKIAAEPGFEEKLNRYNVIKLDINGEYQAATDKAQFLVRLTKEIKKEMNREFPDVLLEDEDSLAQSILKIYSATGETFVLIFDEYDVLVREQVPDDLFQEFLSFLNGLFKNDTMRPAISLAYLTGILPVVRDKIQSKLNNFKEYTILNAKNLAEFVGFTTEDVKNLCKEYSMDFEECRRWYDGYTQWGFEIYNPESVIEAIESEEFAGYWGMTSTYAAISDRIKQNFAGTKEDVIRMLAGESVNVNVTSYMNTMDSFCTKDDLFTYLIHIGYLAYDRKEKTCRIPNWEIRQEWYSAVRVNEDYAVTNEIICSSKELLERTIRCDAEAVEKALDTSHIHVTSHRSYNNEDALQSAIYLAYLYALNQYTIIREMTTGKVFADVVFIPFVPDMPAM
ncbi:MAG: AAA family ATPase, partial [Lachnospiraceae bacterium]|nr:AAA family ATPase [Lachnospiraceae bacterium]